MLTREAEKVKQKPTVSEDGLPPLFISRKIKCVKKILAAMHAAHEAAEHPSHTFLLLQRGCNSGDDHVAA